MFLVREQLGLTYKQIGALFGNKDHTIVLHACSKIAKGTASDPTLLSLIEAIAQAAMLATLH